jgi:hypothetical protein
MGMHLPFRHVDERFTAPPVVCAHPLDSVRPGGRLGVTRGRSIDRNQVQRLPVGDSLEVGVRVEEPSQRGGGSDLPP